MTKTNPKREEKRATLKAGGYKPAANHVSIQIRPSYAPPAMSGARRG